MSGSNTLKDLADAAQETTGQPDRFKEATETLKRMRETIAPFTKPKGSNVTSTAGKWVDGASVAQRLPPV